MRMALGRKASEEDFQVIPEQIGPCLSKLKELFQEGQIHPWQHVRLSSDDQMDMQITAVAKIIESSPIDEATAVDGCGVSRPYCPVATS